MRTLPQRQSSLLTNCQSKIEIIIFAINFFFFFISYSIHHYTIPGIGHKSLDQAHLDQHTGEQHNNNYHLCQLSTPMQQQYQNHAPFCSTWNKTSNITHLEPMSDVSPYVSPLGHCVRSRWPDLAPILGPSLICGIATGLEWPRMHQPSHHAWALWKQALTDVLYLGCNWCLVQPLGKWHVHANSHSWFYHRPTNLVWQCMDAHWTHHGCLLQQIEHLGFHGTGQVETLPPLEDLEWALVLCSGQKLVITGNCPCKHGINLCHYIQSDPLSTHWDPVITLIGPQQQMLAEYQRNHQSKEALNDY